VSTRRLDQVASEAAARYRAASRALDTARQKALAPGREVSWEHGGHLRWGRVTDYAFGRVKVLRETTGMEYWVDCWRILEITPAARE
jgi:hypothetical protein